MTFFICANWYVWGNVHEGEARRIAASKRERKERIMLFLFQRPCCPKLAKVYGNQTGRGQMKWFGTVALLPM